MNKQELLKIIYKGTGNRNPSYQQIDNDFVLFLTNKHIVYYLIVNDKVVVYDDYKYNIVFFEDISEELSKCNLVSLRNTKYSNIVCNLLQYYKSQQEHTWVYEGERYKAVEYDWNNRKDGDLLCLHKYYFTTYRTHGRYCLLPFIYEVKGQDLYSLKADKSISYFDYSSTKLYLENKRYISYYDCPVSSFSLSSFEITLLKQVTKDNS